MKNALFCMIYTKITVVGYSVYGGRCGCTRLRLPDARDGFYYYERISWATSLSANQRGETRHFEGRSELRLDCAEYHLPCPLTVIMFSRRTGAWLRRYIALTALPLKRIGKINGDWSCSPVYCGLTRDTSYQGVQTGSTGGFTGRTVSHCIVDYSVLRWTGT